MGGKQERERKTSRETEGTFLDTDKKKKEYRRKIKEENHQEGVWVSFPLSPRKKIIVRADSMDYL